MRILWISNAPWAGSGYGMQTDIFTKRFVQAGHDVAIVANHGLQHKPTDYQGIMVFPIGGEDSIETFANYFQADFAITLYDSWTMHPELWSEVNMGMWAPIDHWPIPPDVLNVLQKDNVRPIAMSRFGESWMQRMHLDDALYVPHGVDTEIFKPMPEARDVVRDRLEIPQDAFVVGMVAANAGWNPQVSRKSLPQAFDAFGRFLKKHKDAYLYVHTRLRGGGRGVDDLANVAKIMEIPEDRLRTPDPAAWHLGIMDEVFVSGIYNTFDVLLNPSMSEGFGIPIIEAQACGVPVITSDSTAMPELTKSGWMVQGDRWWNDSQFAFALMPHIGSIVECLERAYANRDNQTLKDDARTFALTYDADRVMEKYWTPVLEEMAKPREVAPLNNGKPSRQVLRAQERRTRKAEKK